MSVGVKLRRNLKALAPVCTNEHQFLSFNAIKDTQNGTPGRPNHLAMLRVMLSDDIAL
jgi:hypothetical protein